jgi:hypothetical protein
VTQPAASGTFTLSFGGETTTAISLSSDPATQATAIATALTALSSIGSGNVSVIYDATSSSDTPRFKVTFIGTLAGQDVTQITASGTALSGASIATATQRQGIAATGESQRVVIQTPGKDGEFMLSLQLGGVTRTTAAIATAATQDEVEAALQAVVAGVSGATIEAAFWNGTELEVRFGGTLAGTDLPMLSGAALTPVTPANLEQTQAGVSRAAIAPSNETLVVDYVAQPLTIPTGPNTTLTFDIDGQLGELVEASGTLVVGIADFVEVSGDWGFRLTSKSGIQRLTAGITGGSAFVGKDGGTVDEMGIRLSEVQLGLLIIDDPSAAELRYAVDGSGEASLVGIDDVTLDGTLSVRINRTDAPVDETVTTAGGEVRLRFESPTDITQIEGTATVSIAGFVDLSGEFTLQVEETTENAVTTTRILAAATNVEAFLGTNSGQTDETGVRLSDGMLGLVFEGTESESGYAAVASGSVALVGISGLTLEGTAEVRVNRLGKAVDETIGGVDVKFDEATDVTQFNATAILIVDGFVEVGGEFSFEKAETTVANIATTRIKVAGTNINAFLGSGRGTADEIGDHR